MLQTRLTSLGFTLPKPPKPIAKYDPIAVVGDVLVVSGQLPMLDGEIVAVGKVGQQVSLEQAMSAAQQATLNALALIDQHFTGDWKFRFRRMVKATIYVASDHGFTDQHLVADAVSKLLTDVLGQGGRHARAAVGCVSLPLDAPVEVELMVEWVSDLSRSD